MKAFWIAPLLALAVVGAAQARGGGGSHAVKGYTKADGTYAAPHTAADPGYGSSSASSGTGSSTSDHVVSGYTRQDGTYVQPYRATNPNGAKNDNFSTRGNVNPYTGALGTKPGDGQ